jgi:hypothetical protein
MRYFWEDFYIAEKEDEILKRINFNISEYDIYHDMYNYLIVKNNKYIAHFGNWSKIQDLMVILKVWGDTKIHLDVDHISSGSKWRII